MRQTPNGQNVTTFGIATNREWTTQTGEKKSSAEFHECVAWAKLAEICANYLKKGNLVYVEGYLKTRNWESQEGVRKFKTEIVVQDMIILEKRADREGSDYVPTGDDSDDNDFTDEKAPEETPEEPKDDPKEEPKEEEPKEEEPQAQEASAEQAPEEEEKPSENPIDKDLGL